MGRCANTEALNRHLADEEEQEVALENFTDSIEDELIEIEGVIARIKTMAKDFDGYDFSDEIKELVLERM